MRVETQFSVFLINKPGVLGSVASALGEAGINLFALSLSDLGEHGVLRLVCKDAEKTRQVLRETHDRWTETDVLVIPLGNEPGAFAALTQKLAHERINVIYAYCTANEDGGGTCTAIFKVADPQKALELLSG
ncbi:MAG TPA: ACT domain-containing protein [Phycisphaerae bacterium]|nr:ACT domain-containing protein [Phycisphaerae bacterium]